MPTKISLETTTRDRLRGFGNARMSDDEIVRRLMDEVDRERFLSDLHRAAHSETKWVELDKFDWDASTG
jgi:hypothetical protein